MKLVKKIFEEAETYQALTFLIIVDGQEVGKAEVVISGEDMDEAYIEEVDVYEEFRNKGYGTKALKEIAGLYWFTYLAPTDENNQRLYERIGEEITENAPEVDQGFGVYEIFG